MASSAAKVIWGEGKNTNTTDPTDNATPQTTSNTTTDTTTDTTNTTTAATKMNNETQGQEPVSGKLGDTTKGEPFDAGNIGAINSPHLRIPNDHISFSPKTFFFVGPAANHPVLTIETGETAQSKGPTAEHPSTTGDTGGFKAAQADIRDPESNPTTDPKTETQRKNVDDTGSLDKSENPGKVDGPGPKTIEEIARDRGGDAGNTAERANAEAAKEGGAAGEDKESKGTGEQYVKTSGLAADGGDFDATKPGAGREADRKFFSISIECIL